MASTLIRKNKPTIRSQTTKSRIIKEENPRGPEQFMVGRPQKDAEAYLQTVNMQGLNAKNFAKLLIKQHLSSDMVNDFTDDLKKMKDKDERAVFLDMLNKFYKSGMVEKINTEDKSDAFKFLYARMNKLLNEIRGKPSLGEIQDVPEISKQILEQGGNIKSASGESLVYNPPKKGRKKAITAKVPMAPVGSTFAPVESMPFKNIEGISNEKPTPGQNSIEEQLNPPSTNNPSDVNSASGTIIMGNNGNSLVTTAMLGTNELYNEQSLANTQNNPLISNGGINSVGIPSNSVAPDLNNRNIQDKFVAEQTENDNIKTSSGDFERKEYNDIVVPQKTGIDSLDLANTLANEQQYNEFLKSQGLPIIEPMMRPQKPVSSLFKPKGGAGLIYAQQPSPKRDIEIEQAIKDAENANARLRKMQELEQADADKREIAQIGSRTNTGLATRVSVAGRDVMTKPIEEVFKSVNAYSNRSWIAEGARNQSTLGKNSSIQKMHDIANEERFTDTFNPILYIQRDIADIVNDYKDEFRRTMGKRMIPQYSGSYIQERIPQYAQGLNYSNRPVGSREPTFDNIYDWTYDHCCVVGTQNIGLSPMYPAMVPRIDYVGNPIIFPNTMREIATGVKKYF